MVSENIVDIIHKCEVKPSYRSDHSIIELDIILNHFKTGKGVWKLNNSLLKNSEYLNLINKIIKEEAIKYTVPVYDLMYLEKNYNDITFTIGCDVFLEMLLLRIRGETIKFATFAKKNISKEKELIKDIEYLERNIECQLHNLNLLSDKKADLEKLRESKIKGEQVRSRIQWLSEGEKTLKNLL